MLMIYGALGMGGVETFFVRIAKERHRKGKITKILLQYPEKSNKELLEEIKKYAEVFIYEDIFYTPKIAKYFKLLSPTKKYTLTSFFENVDQIHTFHGDDTLLGYKLSNLANKSLPISVGFYHYIYYLWGGENIPYNEKINRKFVLSYLPKELLMMFSKDNIELYKKYANVDLSKASTFSIGVIDKKSEFTPVNEINTIRLCAIGRLVEFKTYNLYMIDVIEKVISSGVKIEFDIYGTGPLRNKMQELITVKGLDKYIRLKGNLDYSKFDETVSSYDIFIGTGTAIVQATALGVPSITAIDNLYDPKSYGYFSEVYNRQYGRKGLDIDLVDIYTMIKNYSKFTLEEKNNLRKKHIACVDRFIIENSVKSIDYLKGVEMPRERFEYSLFYYETSKILNKLRQKFDKNYYLNIRTKLPKES